MLVKIPDPKLLELKALIEDFKGKKKTTLKQLQSLLGKLNFFTRAILPGRAFVRRLCDATIGVTKPRHHISVNKAMHGDLSIWSTFLDSFNGQVYFLDQEWTSDESLQLFTDSSGALELGCGAFFHGEWCYLGWSSCWQEILGDMTFLELVPVVLAVYLWADKLANKKVILHIDNQALVAILNKQSSKSKLVMSLVRPLVLKCMQYNILFRAVYISTKLNIIADSISRKQWERFRHAAPEADPAPLPIPSSFTNLISSLNLTNS
jgi:hypothetical protein